MGLRHNRSCKNVLTYHEDRTVGMLQAVFSFSEGFGAGGPFYSKLGLK